MVITAILAGLTAIGAALIVDQIERQRPVLQPVPVRSQRKAQKAKQ